MNRIYATAGALLASVALVLPGTDAAAQPKDKDRKEQKEERGKPDRPQGGKDDKEKKPKKAKHENGKQLAGDKVKKDGRHKLKDHGKHSAFIDVKGGKIAGVSVKHAEKGDVPVKKYKSTKNPMTAGAPGGWQTVAFVPVQQTYLGETWIGYAYIDDWGYEVIYWFPYDMVYDGDTGAIEYIPIYD